MIQYNTRANKMTLKYYQFIQVRANHIPINDNHTDGLESYLITFTKRSAFKQKLYNSFDNNEKFKLDRRLNPALNSRIPIERSSTNRPQFHPL